MIRSLLKQSKLLGEKLVPPVTSQVQCLAKMSEYVPRRAVLYVPGNDERKLRKIPSLEADCAVMDCEDGVAANRKV